MLWGSIRKVERISFHSLKSKHTKRGGGGGILSGERWLDEGEEMFSFFPNWKSLLVSLSSWVLSSHYPSTKPFYKLDVQQDKQAANAVSGEEGSDWYSENQTAAGCLPPEKARRGCCVWDVNFAVVEVFSFCLFQSTMWNASTVI